MHYHTGANMPGCLPESDVYCFDDVEAAVETFRSELERAIDDEKVPESEWQRQSDWLAEWTEDAMVVSLRDQREGFAAQVNVGRSLPVIHWVTPHGGLPRECELYDPQD